MTNTGYAIGTGALDTPSEQLLLGYFGTNGTDGLFDADQLLTVMLGPFSGITNADFGVAEDEKGARTLHLARRLYNANAQLTYDDLRRYMTQLTGYGPKLWERIFADQLKCTREMIEVSIGKSYYNFWDDQGDYLNAALNLSQGLLQHMRHLDYEGLWAFLDDKVRFAGQEYLRLTSPEAVEAGVLHGWESWDDAADDALSDYACDGVGDKLRHLVKLMMALMYFDAEGS